MDDTLVNATPANTLQMIADSEMQAERMAQLYAALSHCNQAIVRCTGETELFQEICRIAVEFGKMKMAWIGMLDAAAGTVRTVAFHGMSAEYVESIQVELDYHSSFWRDPVSDVILQDSPVWCQDFQHDSYILPLKTRAAQYGCRRLAALPLHKGGAVAGVFTLYTDDAHAFDQAARDLLIEMACDVDYALDNIRCEQERRHMELAMRDSENCFRELFQKTPLPYHSLDIHGHILEVNEKWLCLLGYSRQEVIGRFFGEFVSNESLAHPAYEFPRFVSAGIITGATFEMLCKNGSQRLWTVHGQIARDDDGNFLRTHCIYTDVTERRKAEEQLHLAARVFEQSSEGFMVTNADNCIVMVNKAFSKITGYAADEVLGHKPSILSSGHHKPDFYRDMWDAIASAGYWHGEVLNRKKSGQLCLTWLSISRMLDSAGQHDQYIATFCDITGRRAVEEKVEWLTHFDTLTGLPNRTLLEDRCKLAISMAQRSKSSVALMMLDLDNFKHVNEALGYQIGDNLVSHVGRSLTTSLREQDTVSRIGGDDFVILLPNTGADGAAHLAEKLLNQIRQPHRLGGHDIGITASIGIAIYPDNGDDLDTLTRRAESAMYRAKHEGRNSSRFFSNSVQEQTFRKLQLENGLRRALEHDQFQLHYQPIVSLESGHIVGAEALLRWNSPELGAVAPSELIPIAEHNGLILPIGEWVLRTAAQQMKTWLDQECPIERMAVNLSPIQFRQPHLKEMILGILAETKLSAGHLELELTESAAMEDSKAAIAIVEELRGFGIRISIDDFGTGHSSLGHLKHFHADNLKIDRSFVRDIADGPKDKAIVWAIANLASNLGLKTVAEGVENQEQLDYLRELGCHEAQGYFFSRPVAADEFKHLFATLSPGAHSH